MFVRSERGARTEDTDEYVLPRWRWALALVLHLWSLPLPAVLQVEKARSLHI